MTDSCAVYSDFCLLLCNNTINLNRVAWIHSWVSAQRGWRIKSTILQQLRTLFLRTQWISKSWEVSEFL